MVCALVKAIIFSPPFSSCAAAAFGVIEALKYKVNKNKSTTHCQAKPYRLKCLLVRLEKKSVNFAKRE